MSKYARLVKRYDASLFSIQGNTFCKKIRVCVADAQNARAAIARKLLGAKIKSFLNQKRRN